MLLDPPPEAFRAPGTQAPTPGTASAAKRFVMVGLVAGSVLSGTITTVTPAYAAALKDVATRSRTLPAVPPALGTPPARPVADVLQRLRRVSGLSWGEIAVGVGVSRRAVHHWLSGGRIADAHVARVLGLERLVALHEAGSAELTRDRLLRPGPGGRPVLDDFRLQAKPRRAALRPTASVSELLSEGEHAPEGVQRPTTRRSALTGGPITRRGQR